MSSPFFSIIMPAFNAEKYIARSIESALRQDYKELELIIIDDGSTDATSECVKYFKEIDKRIVYVKKDNAGPSAARNLGLDLAKGKYVIFLDSDDLLVDNALTTLKETIEENEEPDVVIYGGKVFPVGKHEHWAQKYLNTRNKVYEEFTGELMFYERGTKPFIWQNCIKLSLLNDNNLRINQELLIGEDQTFQFAFFPLAKKVVCIDNKIYLYRVYNNGSLMEKINYIPYFKISEHFRIIAAVDKLWEQNGMKKKYAHDFANWAVELVCWNILEMKDLAMQKHFAQQLKDFVDGINLPSYYLMQPEISDCYHRILNILEKDETQEENYQKTTRRIQEVKDETNVLIHCESYKLGKFLYHFKRKKDK